MNNSSQSVQETGTLDESFADAGIFRLSLPHLGSEILIKGVETQHSPALERLYFTGQARAGIQNRPYLLGRLMPDGTLDDTFGTQGIVSGFFAPRAESLGKSITLLTDGKILLAGRVRGNGIPALARFFSDGTLDLSFGIAGYVVLELPEAVQAQPPMASTDESQHLTASVVPLANGKILVVHTYVVSRQADTRAFIFLLNSEGALDKSFNQKGYVQVVYPQGAPADVKLRSGLFNQDGKITVCAYLAPTSGSSVPLFARYRPDGSLDPDFGIAGFVVSNVPQESATLNTVIGQPNKRLLGIGMTGAAQGLLISLEPDGRPNIQFNRGQPLLTRLDNVDTLWQRAAMQPDGKIVLLGKIRRPETQGEIVIARLLSDGSLDPTFNGVGWVSTRLEKANVFDAISLQTDGKIVIAGYNAPNAQGLVLRYHGRS